MKNGKFMHVPPALCLNSFVFVDDPEAALVVQISRETLDADVGPKYNVDEHAVVPHGNTLPREIHPDRVLGHIQEIPGKRVIPFGVVFVVVLVSGGIGENLVPARGESKILGIARLVVIPADTISSRVSPRMATTLMPAFSSCSISDLLNEAYTKAHCGRSAITLSRLIACADWAWVLGIAANSGSTRARTSDSLPYKLCSTSLFCCPRAKTIRPPK
jgi:hypothetical protein